MKSDVKTRESCVLNTVASLLMGSTMLVGYSVFAQTAQLIITAPSELAGSYAAVTYNSPPSRVTSTTPIAQGNIFVYDGVNCSAHTLTKPVAGSGAGKVALLTGSYPTSCTYYDDIVRELQADGAVAVVFGFSNGSWRTSMSHVNPAGMTVPVLDMQVDEVSQSIRSAVLGGTIVTAAFVAVPGMVLQEDTDALLPGQTHTLVLVPLGSSSTGATWDLSSLDLDRTAGGIQQSVTAPASVACVGVSFNWNAATHLLTATVPANITYTGSCGKTYLIRDTAGYQGIGLVTLYIGVPVIHADIAQTSAGTPVSIDVLANDGGDPSTKVAARLDLDTTTTTIDQTVTSAQGTWRVIGSNVVFTPAAGFIGVASIKYVVRGANGGSSNQATIAVNVGSNPQIAPVGGVWYDPNESGSGYGLDYKDGVLIVQVYSYLAGGAAQWYLGAGNVTNNVFQATLDKYTGGQCISCAYKAPALVGNDGNFTITFTSPTTADIVLPGGRIGHIRRYFPPGAPQPASAPVGGVWYDPNESGSGYGLDYQNGVLIVQVYSYLAGGAAQWYLGAGAVTNNVFQATLDKYTGGQCISCAYKAPALVANDGNFTITFTSPTTADIVLPGGRIGHIQRYFQP